MIWIITGLFLVIFGLPVLPALYFGKGWFKRFFHDVLEWHTPTNEGYDGVSFTSICKHCGKEIMRDSQGNWFTYK